MGRFLNRKHSVQLLAFQSTAFTFFLSIMSRAALGNSVTFEYLGWLKCTYMRGVYWDNSAVQCTIRVRDSWKNGNSKVWPTDQRTYIWHLLETLACLKNGWQGVIMCHHYTPLPKASSCGTILGRRFIQWESAILHTSFQVCRSQFFADATMLHFFVLKF